MKKADEIYTYSLSIFGLLLMSVFADSPSYKARCRIVAGYSHVKSR